MRKITTNERGVSLLQVVIAMGLTGIVALTIMNLSESLMKNQTLAERKAEELEFHQFMVRHFSDQTRCTNTLVRLATSGQFALDVKGPLLASQTITTAGQSIYLNLVGADDKPLISCSPDSPCNTMFGHINPGKFEFSYDQTKSGWNHVIAKYDTSFNIGSAEFNKSHNLNLWVKVNSAGIIESCSGSDAIDYQLVTKTICEQFVIDGKKGVYNSSLGSCALEASKAPAANPALPTKVNINGAASVTKLNGGCGSGTVKSYSLKYDACSYNNMITSDTGQNANCTNNGTHVDCPTKGCYYGGAYLPITGTIECIY